jgi:hypothetical protein
MLLLGLLLMGDSRWASTAAGRGPLLLAPFAEGQEKTSPSQRW